VNVCSPHGLKRSAIVQRRNHLRPVVKTGRHSALAYRDRAYGCPLVLLEFGAALAWALEPRLLLKASLRTMAEND
jgi:hypothetical protein